MVWQAWLSVVRMVPQEGSKDPTVPTPTSTSGIDPVSHGSAAQAPTQGAPKGSGRTPPDNVKESNGQREKREATRRVSFKKVDAHAAPEPSAASATGSQLSEESDLGYESCDSQDGASVPREGSQSPSPSGRPSTSQTAAQHGESAGTRQTEAKEAGQAASAGNTDTSRGSPGTPVSGDQHPDAAMDRAAAADRAEEEAEESEQEGSSEGEEEPAAPPSAARARWIAAVRKIQEERQETMGSVRSPFAALAGVSPPASGKWASFGASSDNGVLKGGATLSRAVPSTAASNKGMANSSTPRSEGIFTKFVAAL